MLIQQVANETQQALEYQVSSLVSLALAAVFDNPYELVLEYGIKYNKTEAKLLFKRDGKKYDPMTCTGGGTKDIASFGLRCSAWALQNTSTRPILILDEPFRYINDPSRSLHKKAAEMVKTVSKELGLQIIMISQIPELHDIADRLINVKLNNNGVSEISCTNKKEN